MLRGQVDPDRLKQAAQEKLKGGFFKCFAGTQRFEDASELFEQAANQYKLSKSYREAAECLIKCVECWGKVPGGTEKEAIHYRDAAGMFLKGYQTKEATENYQNSIDIYEDRGNLSECGNLYMVLAKIYEDGRLDHTKTLDYFQKAFDMYDLVENAKTKRRDCNLKVAEYCSLTGRQDDIDKAIKIFENEGKSDLKNSLTKYGARESFLKAGILHLARGDAVTVNIKLEEYNSCDVAFPNSREGELFKDLAFALETSNVELFEEKLEAYDAITKLDPWKIDFLLKSKATIQQFGGDGGLSLEDGGADLR